MKTIMLNYRNHIRHCKCLVVVVLGVLVVVTRIAVVVVVALVLFKHLTDGLANHSGTNSSITHNPLGLRAKSVLYTGEISADNNTRCKDSL